jgi:hypothetical protein
MIAQWMGTFVDVPLLQVMQVIFSSTELYVTLLIYSIPTLIILVYLYLNLPETKARTFVHIHEKYYGLNSEHRPVLGKITGTPDDETSLTENIAN